MPLHPHQPPWCPMPPQYTHLVVKSGTTVGQHDMSSACRSGWCFVRCAPTPSPPMPPQCPPGIGIWWTRMVLTWVPLTWAHVLLSAIDHLESSRVLCNRPSSFYICNPQCPLTPTIRPLDACTPPQYRHLAVKSGTTAGWHDMSSACGSGWCFSDVPPPYHTLCPSMPPR